VGSSALILGLRHLRGPIVTMVAVFAIGITGLVLIPGVDANGVPWHMTITQALYFMSYTATTIGFGEMPHAFTATQRLWVTVMIFASVVGWSVLLGALLRLARDEAFRGVITSAAFARGVRSIREPFYLICGFGETGLLVSRTLDRLGRRFVVVDNSPARIQELGVQDLYQAAPALCADARLPENLRAAGLTKRECTGVLALTNDDQVNLAVAMAVRLLNPLTPVIARSMSRSVAANMMTFGTDHVINPFIRFGSHLALALAAPENYRLIAWLTAAPGAIFAPAPIPPRGRWVVCGYGRFGRPVVAALRNQGLDVSVVDPDESDIDGLLTIRGTGTEGPSLEAAGIREAVGIVAGADDDIANLSIAMTALELNQELFTVVRQNLQANSALFQTFAADMTMVSSEIIANECLAVLKTPYLAEFLNFARERDAAWAGAALERLEAIVGDRVPEIWSVRISAATTPALHRGMTEGQAPTIGDLARNPANRDTTLPLLPLTLTRDGQVDDFPDAGLPLESGDQLLYAGTPEARRQQSDILLNVNVCDYVVAGINAPQSLVWHRLKAILRPSLADAHTNSGPAS
jgi:Trk K+ transport system NAD-binding subunit